jgi:uncharacterized protein (TIGR03089 family)
VPAETPAGLWRSAAAADPARPFVTAYDAATGGRVELSYATFDNWVAKTANLITDGLRAGPGERVALALPAHWQALVWLVAAWSTGLTAVPVDRGGLAGAAADIAVADADGVDAALDSGAREVVGASLHPLGMPLADCPPAALDYAVEVRGFGDRFAPGPVDPGAPALDTGDGVLSGAELAALARGRAAEWELTAADRVAIITSTPGSLADLGPELSRFLAPVAGAVPLVLTPGDASANLQARLGMERVTAVADARPGSPALPGEFKPLP